MKHSIVLLKVAAIIIAIYSPIISHSLKLYSFYTPSHTVFKNDWFLPSLQDSFELIIKFYPQECTQAQWMKPGWTTTTLHKIDMILEAIEDNWEDVFIYSDIDIQFFEPMQDIIEKAIQGKDLLFQRHNPQGSVCSGFFVCRANTKTRQLFLDVQKMMRENIKWSDQPTINRCLITHKNPYGIIWDYLPVTFFGGGTIDASKKAWRPGAPLTIPEGIVLHHANCTRGIANKIAQLEYVRYEVNQRKNR